jgi:ABC-type multidrug transport system permease subunit
MLGKMSGASWKYEVSGALMLMVLFCGVVRLNSIVLLVLKFCVYLHISKIFFGARLV